MLDHQTEGAGYLDPAGLYSDFIGILSERELTSDIAKWAAANITLPDDTPFPGRYRPERMPAQLGVMGALNPAASHVDEVVLCAPGQSGKSFTTSLFISRLVDEDPCRILIATPTDEGIGDWRGEKLEKLWATCPRLAHLVEDKQGRRHNEAEIELPSLGQIHFRSAGKVTTWQQNAYRVVVCDDAARMRPPKEGNLLVLARQRTQMFALTGRKVLLISTPTTKTNQFWVAWLGSSRNRIFMPCPHCRAFQKLDHPQMRWTPGRPDTVYMECVHNQCRIRQLSLAWMLPLGQWRPQNPAIKTRQGFRWSQLDLPVEMASWVSLAHHMEAAEIQLATTGEDDLKQAVYNQMHALPWEPAHDKKLLELGVKIYDRREPIFDEAKLPIVVRAVGLDVQRNRTEAFGWGFGAGFEAWSLWHDIQHGVWSDPRHWDAAIAAVIAWRPDVVCIDAGFTRTDRRDTETPGVLQQLNRLFHLFEEAGIYMWAVKGFSGLSYPLWPLNTTVHNGHLGPSGEVRPVNIYVDQAKNWAYRSLAKPETSGPSIIHIDTQRGKKWIAQLTSERRTKPGDRAGKKIYIPVSPKARNEVLDGLVMAKAGVHGICAMVPELAAGMESGPRLPPLPIAQPAVAPPVAQAPSPWTGTSGNAGGAVF